MKKILTLMISVATAASVFAAPSSHGAANVPALANAYPGKEREKQIERINRDYDQRIESIRRDRHLKGYEKDRQIRMLQEQRDRSMREVNQRYHYYENDRHEDHKDHKDWKH